jgi:hypothetical protein
MPQRCYIVPNRSQPRLFNEGKAASILCTVLRQGGSRALFEEELERRCPDGARQRGNSQAEALAVAAEALAENQQLVSADLALLSRFLTFLGFLAVIQRVIAFAGVPGRLASIAFIGLQTAVRERVAVLTTQSAANDAALVIVRRAAANEARFLQRAGRAN